MPNFLTGIIDRAEGDFVVIKIAGEQELYWPKNSISFNYELGDAVNIYLTKEETAAVDSEEKTKNILRRIFQPNVQVE